MDNETKVMLQQILSEVTSLKDNQAQMSQDLYGVKQDLYGAKQDLYDVKQLAIKTALIIENDISKKLGYLYDQAQDNVRHYKEQKQLSITVENLQHDVSALKIAYKEVLL